MSRELPYFKFFSSEWLNGDITLEDYELQGVFINLCAYYWHKEGLVELVQSGKKLRTERVNELIKIGLVKENGGNLTIDFLDEQLSEFSVRKKQLSDAGKKGAARKKKLAENKPPLSQNLTTLKQLDKEKEKEKDKSKIISIEVRKTAFKKSLSKHKENNESKTLNDFFSYWTEHGDSDKKMRFEKQTSFSIGRRLGTWKTNEKNYGFKSNIKDNRATTTKAGRQDFE
mgnify:FL=1